MEFVKTLPYLKALKRIRISEIEENILYEELTENPKKGRLSEAAAESEKSVWRFAVAEKARAAESFTFIWK